MTNVKQFKLKTNGLIYVHKNERKTNMQHINKRQPLNYRLLTWDRHIHTEYGGVKHVSGILHPRPFPWDRGVTVLHNNSYSISDDEHSVASVHVLTVSLNFFIIRTS